MNFHNTFLKIAAILESCTKLPKDTNPYLDFLFVHSRLCLCVLIDSLTGMPIVIYEFNIDQSHSIQIIGSRRVKKSSELLGFRLKPSNIANASTTSIGKCPFLSIGNSHILSGSKINQVNHAVQIKMTLFQFNPNKRSS